MFALGYNDYGLITLSNLRGIKVNCEKIAICDSITCKILDMRKKLVVASIFLCLMNSSFASAQISNFEDPRLTLSTVEADWLIKTDKTERPQVGSSSAILLKAEDELQFQGELAAIAGNGGLVGFAFVEAPLSLDLSAYKYIEFYAKSKDPGVVYTLTLKDEQAQQDTGTLTFEQEFVVGTEWTKVKLPLSHFRAKIRGRIVDNFQLDLQRVRSLSFQINRSNQEADSPIPLQFALDIGSEVYVTNQD